MIFKSFIMEVKRINFPVLISMFVILIQQINGISGDTTRPSAISSPDGTICKNGGTQISSNLCMCPGGLVGKNCDHSLYISFDTLENLTLMEGTERSNFEALVIGPVNSAVYLNKSKSQWIDLGFHPEVCLTQRYGCGVAGSAVSLWLRLIEFGGIITTRSAQSGRFFLATGLNIFCYGLHTMRYILVLPNGYDILTVPIKSPQRHWFHIVFNIIGPNDGQGFRIYHDGILAGNVTRFHKRRSTAVDGRIVIGRFFTDRNSGSDFPSFEMDELLFFNRPLTEEEIKMMNN